MSNEQEKQAYVDGVRHDNAGQDVKLRGSATPPLSEVRASLTSLDKEIPYHMFIHTSFTHCTAFSFFPHI
jgi:hypothetical protein